MSRLLIPQLSFADLQLQNLGIHLDLHRRTERSVRLNAY